MLKENLIKLKYVFKELSIKDKEKKYYNEIVKDLEDKFRILSKLEISQTLLDMDYDNVRVLPLDEKKCLVIYHIIGTMLGVIDSGYDYYEREISKYVKFDYNKNKVDKLINEEEEILSYRNRVLDDYYSIMEEPLIEYSRVIETVPSYNEFDILFNIMHDYKRMGYESEFISSYMNGYHYGRVCNTKSVIEYYNNLFNNYQYDKDKGKDDIKRVRKIGK